MDSVVHTPDVARPASEHPAETIRRLGRELSEALAVQCELGFECAVIYKAGAQEYPISLCLDDNFARSTQALFRYRNAVMARFNHEGSTREMRRLHKAVDEARMDLDAVLIRGAQK